MQQLRQRLKTTSKWWIYLFYGTILFGIAYTIYYHLGGPGLTSEANLKIAMAELEAMKPAQAATLPVSDLLTLANDTSRVSAGRGIYTARCTPCHGVKGEGIVGPNLTDDNWIHGGKISDIKKVIEEGVLAKGMLAWKGQLSDEELLNVTLFVWSLRGTNPPNPKAPEGEKFEREN